MNPPNDHNPFLGVSWHMRRDHYRVKLKVDGKHVHLGVFQNPEDAARVWDAAKLLVCKPERLNFDGNPPESVSVAEIRAKLVKAGVLRK